MVGRRCPHRAAGIGAQICARGGLRTARPTGLLIAEYALSQAHQTLPENTLRILPALYACRTEKQFAVTTIPCRTPVHCLKCLGIQCLRFISLSRSPFAELNRVRCLP